MRSIRGTPLGFAHRGGRADAPENTLEAFGLALASGATALESDAWTTADGVVVLDHDGVGPGLRRRRIADVERSLLPDHVPALTDLYGTHGTDFDLSLDLRDPATAGPTIAAAESAGHPLERLWLCAADDVAAATTWKAEAPGARVVDSTRRKHMKGGSERHAATLAECGIDAVNLHHTDWSLGLVTLFHRFEVLAFAWDCQHERVLDDMLRMGIDAVFSDHVARMNAAIARGRG